jgi:hypothetical protein
MARNRAHKTALEAVVESLERQLESSKIRTTEEIRWQMTRCGERCLGQLLLR